MLTIAKIFGKSPFSLLQTHMHKVCHCMNVLVEVFDAFEKRDHAELERQVSQLSSYEHEADLTKNEIRKNMPRSIFLPIDRSQFLEILAMQDDIADKAEDVGNLLVLHPLQPIPEISDVLRQFFEKNVETFRDVREIVREIGELIESSFGGKEAEKVKSMIEQASFKEHESDIMKRSLLKVFFEKAESLSTPQFYMWTKLIEEIGAISHISENLAIRIRLILET
ncbi:MAG: TIGR00153 family protein [Simkaniaceae bacterium]|nr:TIGR00153 family protein [Simkaniaceae bacterium]